MLQGNNHGQKLPACPIKSFPITETKIHSRIIMLYKVNYSHPRWPRPQLLLFPGWPIFKLPPWHLGVVSPSPQEGYGPDLQPSGLVVLSHHQATARFCIRLTVFSEYQVLNSLLSYIYPLYSCDVRFGCVETLHTITVLTHRCHTQWIRRLNSV
jgi:hypothetical protein